MRASGIPPLALCLQRPRPFFLSAEKQRPGRPHRAALLVLLVGWAGLLPAEPTRAASWYVAAGTTQDVSGALTYETADIRGTLRLTGSTQITIDWGLLHPGSPPTNVLVFSEQAKIICNNSAGAAGTDGAAGANGTAGGEGEAGHDLTIEVHGDVLFSNATSITLSGGPGGSGGDGGSNGGNGGSGGRGGDGGDFRMIVHGTLTAVTDLWVMVQGGPGGFQSGSGGDGVVPGTPGMAGHGGHGGDIEIRARETPNARLTLQAIGGDGGDGGAGGDGTVCGAGGTPGGPGGEGGEGGDVRFTTCGISTTCTVNATGGEGGSGGSGGMAGASAGCLTLAAGVRGGNGGPGGSGGRAEITTASATGLVVRAPGGKGGSGGQGGISFYVDAGTCFCGGHGGGGNGGNGGEGGSSILHIPTNAWAGTSNNVAGGAGGLGAPGGVVPRPPCSTACGIGPTGLNGSGGGSGSIIYDPIATNGLQADLQVDKAAVHAGQTLDYTLQVKALKQTHLNLLIKLPIPSNTVLIGATTNYTLVGDTLQWSVSALAECDFLIYTQQVMVAWSNAPGTLIVNQARVSASGIPEFATTTVTTRVMYDERPNYGKNHDVPYHSDPVHPGLGNYVCSKDLVTIPAPSLPVLMEATYNSRDNAADGPLGFGWTHTYNVALSETSGVATLRMGDGQVLTFRALDATNFAPFGCATRLTLRKPATNRYEAAQYNGVIYVFDGQGRLTRLEDPNGLHVDLTHSTQLDRITDTAGRQVDFTWQTGRVSAIAVVPLGRSVQFQYDAASNLAAIVNLRGHTNRFAYDADHRMTTEWDARGYPAMSNVYDTAGRVVRQVNALNQQTCYAYTDYDLSGLRRVDISGPGGSGSHAYDTAMNITEIVDTRGRAASFSYDGQGRRLTAADKLGQEGSFQYDPAGNPTTLVSRAGEVTRLSYSPHNRVTAIRDGAGATFNMGFDAQGNLASTTDPLNNQRQFVCNAAGQPTTITDARSKSWHITYNAQGAIETVTDPAGNTATYTYDALGRLVSSSQPGNPSIQTFLSFDAAGNPTSTVDRAGQRAVRVFDPNNNLLSVTFEAHTATTYYAYNALNQLTNVTDALGGQTVITHDFAGRMASTRDPDGVVVCITYDQAGRLAARMDGLGQTTRFAYDDNGNVIAATNARGKAWRFRYDAENRLVGIEDAYGATRGFGYDARGRLTAVTNADGTVATRVHDALGRIIRSTAEDGGITEYAYDGNGNLTQLTDPLGRTWEYEYDDVSRRILARDPLGREETYRYNAAGFMTNKITRDGKSYRYDHDALGRLTAVALPDGAGTVQFQYDAAGNLTNAADASGPVSMTYDKLNRKTSFTDRHGNMLQYRYTPGGRLAAVVYPGDRALTNQYDGLGRVTNTLDWTGRRLSFQYDSLNQVTNIGLPNGTRKTYAYDDERRITRLRHLRSDGQIIEHIELSYDIAGRVTGRTRNTTGLVAAVSSGFGRYTCDAAGRLLSRVGDGVTNLCYFDARGNMTSKTVNAASTTLRYDPLNRLISTSGSGLTVSNAYDASGNRDAQWVNGVETRWLTDGGRAYMKYTGSGAIDRYYVYAGGLAYSLDAASNLVVFHDDERGSILELSDYTQVVVQAYAYSPYGTLKAAQGSATNEFRFTGARGTAADTNGLLFMKARYYDPELARFITEDPLGLAAGLNLYAYAGGDPVGKIDPHGLQEKITLPPKVLPPTLPSKILPQVSEANIESMQQQILRYEAEAYRNSQWGEYWLKQGNLPAASESAQKAAQYQQTVTQLETDLYKQAPGLKNADWRGSTPFKHPEIYQTLPEIGEQVAERGFSPGRFVSNVGRGIYRTGSGIINAVKEEIVYYVTCGSIPVGTYLQYLIAQGAEVAIVEGGFVVIVLAAEGIVVYAVTEEVMYEAGIDPVSDPLVYFFSVFVPLADNAPDPAAYLWRQDYYDMADRCDQKIKDILATGLIRLDY